MAEESTHEPTPQPEAPPASGKRRKPRTRRWWIRLFANLLIVAGVLFIPAYYAGTCACTAIEQNRLRDDLEASNPGLAAAEASLASDGFVSVDGTTETTLDPSATPEELTAAEAAIAAAKAERDAKFAEFKAAADAFEVTLGGQIGQPIGKILVPSIGVDVVMIEGTSKGDLKEGPGHWEETPFPGQGGNFVVSGHRTTYGAPFFKLDDVKVGDEITLVLPYAVVRYMVSKTFICLPNEVDTVAQRGREQVSLAACHPIYSARQRIVAQGELTGFKLIEAGAVAP
jgi:LPXTG-site transpeptidase (sortase) family protein